MPSTATTADLQGLNSQGLVMLLMLEHAALAAPVRLAQDTRNVVSNGETYLALPMQVTLPADKSGEAARAQLRLDNVGRDLVGELEKLPTTAVLMATLSWVGRATPDVVEYSFKSPLENVRADVLAVSASLGDDNLWRRPAVLVRFDPVSAPGLFAD